MTNILTRDAIASAQDITTEEVFVPQWGGSVLVRGMTGDERNAYESQIVKEVPAGNRMARRAGQTTTEVIRDEIRARLIVWCVVDSDGKPLFTEADIPMINKKSAAALELIVDAATRLSGMDDGDVERIAADMVKNPTNGSSSA